MFFHKKMGEKRGVWVGGKGREEGVFSFVGVLQLFSREEGEKGVVFFSD